MIVSRLRRRLRNGLELPATYAGGTRRGRQQPGACSTETHHPRLASQPPLSLTPWKPVALFASLTLTKRLRMAKPLGPLEAALRFP